MEQRLQNHVEPRLLELFATQARALVSQLRSGAEIDEAALAQGLGSTLEYILCGLFAEHETARVYWCDGVVLKTPISLSDGSVVASGYAWCAGHREQWQVPAQVSFALSNETIEFLRISIGDARYQALNDRRQSRAILAILPDEWILEFDVALKQ